MLKGFFCIRSSNYSVYFMLRAGLNSDYHILSPQKSLMASGPMLACAQATEGVSIQSSSLFSPATETFSDIQ